MAIWGSYQLSKGLHKRPPWKLKRWLCAQKSWGTEGIGRYWSEAPSQGHTENLSKRLERPNWQDGSKLYAWDVSMVSIWRQLQSLQVHYRLSGSLRLPVQLLCSWELPSTLSEVFQLLSASENSICVFVNHFPSFHISWYFMISHDFWSRKRVIRAVSHLPIAQRHVDPGGCGERFCLWGACRECATRAARATAQGWSYNAWTRLKLRIKPDLKSAHQCNAGWEFWSSIKYTVSV